MGLGLGTGFSRGTGVVGAGSSAKTPSTSTVVGRWKMALTRSWAPSRESV
jgi:hypothetical protein